MFRAVFMTERQERKVFTNSFFTEIGDPRKKLTLRELLDGVHWNNLKGSSRYNFKLSSALERMFPLKSSIYFGHLAGIRVGSFTKTSYKYSIYSMNSLKSSNKQASGITPIFLYEPVLLCFLQIRLWKKLTTFLSDIQIDDVEWYFKATVSFHNLASSDDGNKTKTSCPRGMIYINWLRGDSPI